MEQKMENEILDTIAEKAPVVAAIALVATIAIKAIVEVSKEN